MQTALKSRYTWIDGLFLFAAAVCGLLDLAYPFTGDSAMFSIFSHLMSQGAVLYRDLWDLKPPAIFWFYQAAGAIFGAGPLGPGPLSVHALELFYFLAFAVFAQVALKPYVRHPVAASTIALLFVGCYYAIAEAALMAQVEGLVGPALFLMTWAVVTAAQRGHRPLICLFAGGVAGGFVVIFKPLLLIVVIATAVTAWSVASGEKVNQRPRLFVSIVLYLLGVAAIPAGVAVYFAYSGALGALLTTMFSEPRYIFAVLPTAPLHRGVSIVWFAAKSFAPLWLLALAAAFFDRFSAARPWKWAMLAWLVSGSAVIALQRQSWWPHHVWLLLVPLSVLAAFGIDGLLDTLFSEPSSRRAAGAVVCVAAALLFLLLAVRDVSKLRLLAGDHFALTASQREAFRRVVSGEYAEAQQDASALRASGDRDRSIYIAGNPLMYRFLHALPAIGINGFSLEYAPPNRWGQLFAEMRTVRPTDIYVEADYLPLIAQRAPRLSQYISRQYVKIASNAAGAWYARRPAVLTSSPER